MTEPEPNDGHTGATPPADPTATGGDALGPAGIKALEAERAARKELEKRLAAVEPLSKLAEAMGLAPGKTSKTDVEQLAERLSAQEKELATERSLRLRLEVAQEKGLTAAQAARLQGATKEELAKDADDLKALFPGGATPPASPPGATPATPAAPAFAGGADGGPRPNTTAAQLGEADLKRMTPEQIVEARGKGQLNDLLGVKTT